MQSKIWTSGGKDGQGDLLYNTLRGQMCVAVGIQGNSRQKNT